MDSGLLFKNAETAANLKEEVKNERENNKVLKGEVKRKIDEVEKLKQLVKEEQEKSKKLTKEVFKLRADKNASKTGQSLIKVKAEK